MENLTTNFKPKCPCSYICICICIYIYVCILYHFSWDFGSFLTTASFTHSLTLFQNKHLVLGIWYCQSIQNPRPNTCWFLIQNLVSHGILTYFQTNSVKIFIRFCLHVNALVLMRKCEHDLILRGECWRCLQHVYLLNCRAPC